MNHAELEKTYEALALKIDAVGAEHSERFLAKLALLLAHEIGDAKRVVCLIDEASAALEL